MNKLRSFDLHIHTVHSGDSPCKVEEAIETAKKIGLDGISITDHDSTRGSEIALYIVDDDFLIIPGIEISSKDGHILGLGIEDSVKSDLPASETVKRIRDRGGIAISAHPFSFGLSPFSPLKSDFDAIEVYNPRRYLGNRLARKYAEDHDIAVSAGSDAHFKDEIGLAGVKLDCNLDLEEVLEKIKRGEAEVFGRPLPISGYWRRIFFRLFS